jgi:hypothetical protein
MFLKLVKAGQIEVDGRPYHVHYYERRTLRGVPRYSCEVLLGSNDRIILDDDSMPSLESRVARLVPATIYSRSMAS